MRGLGAAIDATSFGPAERDSMWPKGIGARALHGFGELSRGAVDLVLPPSCADCGARVGPRAALCTRCELRLERLPRRACALCQQVPRSVDGDYCAHCANKSSPLLACVAAFRFEGRCATWIHRFKYPPRGLRGLDPAPAAVVAAMLRSSAARAPDTAPELVIPVPLHPRRLRARGFNPAAEIARPLARRFDLAFDAVALRRTRDTPSQTGLDRDARRRNVRRAFELRRGRSLPERVWLVDDVVTTGSTLREAALALRATGASSVVGLCAARSISELSSANR